VLRAHPASPQLSSDHEEALHDEADQELALHDDALQLEALHEDADQELALQDEALQLEARRSIHAPLSQELAFQRAALKNLSPLGSAEMSTQLWFHRPQPWPSWPWLSRPSLPVVTVPAPEPQVHSGLAEVRRPVLT
jgi:hypothetical protein